MSEEPSWAAAAKVRFGEGVRGEETGLGPAPRAALARLMDRRVCRRFKAERVPEGLMRLVLATGLAAPSKSDLQQADIVWVQDVSLRAEVIRGCGSWLEEAPEEVEVLVICGDGRRLAGIHGPDWVNDHFDALFNASGDAAILLANIVAAAALAGLGACPVSVMRNRAAEIANLLALPERVFPFAGLALGVAAEPRAALSPRLGLDATLHIDHFDAAGQEAAVAAYDARRAELQNGSDGRPFVWTEAKLRQYSEPQRTDWGAFLRGRGFKMD